MNAEKKSGNDIFSCRMCGRCCKGFGGTYVTLDDIENISRLIGADSAAFTDQYCDPSGSRFVLTRGQDGYCIFFDTEKQCTIHQVKPFMCKAWPFIKTLIANPENWDTMADSCPGMKKGVPDDTIQKTVAIEQRKLNKG